MFFHFESDTTSSIADKRVNSLLDFLDDVTVKDSANTFVPKPFKDLTIDLTDYSDYREKSSASDKPDSHVVSSRTSGSSRGRKPSVSNGLDPGRTPVRDGKSWIHHDLITPFVID